MFATYSLTQGFTLFLLSSPWTVHRRESGQPAMLSATSHSILERFETLRNSCMINSCVQKMNGNTGCKLVASLDSCDHDFNGVAEIVLDRENLEVAANVRFKKSVCSGKYLASPHPIDNFGRPAIFSMNANDTADLDKKVFVNHGWTSLHFYKPVSLDGEYYSYMNMSGPEAGCLHGGEMVVSEGTEIVAAFNVIKPQGVPRRLMNYTVRLRDNTSQGPLTAVTRQLIEAPSVNTGPSVVV